jgi:hypothetical protein
VPVNVTDCVSKPLISALPFSEIVTADGTDTATVEGALSPEDARAVFADRSVAVGAKVSADKPLFLPIPIPLSNEFVDPSTPSKGDAVNGYCWTPSGSPASGKRAIKDAIAWSKPLPSDRSFRFLFAKFFAPVTLKV